MARKVEPDLNQLRRILRKGTVTKDLALLAAKTGVRYRFTRDGVMFYGQNGFSFTIHLTEADHRSEKNNVSRFRKIGIELPRKGQK